jgi:hypothetical protein
VGIDVVRIRARRRKRSEASPGRGGGNAGVCYIFDVDAAVSALSPIAGEIGAFPFASLGVHHAARRRNATAKPASTAIVQGPPAAPVQSPPTAAARAASIVDQLEAYVAENLFAASSEQELDEVVEELLDDERYRELRVPLQALGSLQLLAAVAQDGPAPAWLVEAVAPEQRTKVEQADRLMRLQAQATLSFFAELAKQERTVGLEEEFSVTRPPMWFLVDPTVPTAVKSVLLARERVDIYVFAVSASADRATDPRVVGWLLDRWIADQRCFLGLLSVLPGVTISEADLPKSCRLDLQAIVAEHEAAERSYQARLALARARGSSVAFGDPLDDGQA